MAQNRYAYEQEPESRHPRYNIIDRTPRRPSEKTLARDATLDTAKAIVEALNARAK